MDIRISQLLQRFDEIDDSALADLEAIVVDDLQAAADVRHLQDVRDLGAALEQIRGEAKSRLAASAAAEAEIAGTLRRLLSSEEESSAVEPAQVVAAASRPPLPRIADLAARRSSSNSARLHAGSDGGNVVALTASGEPIEDPRQVGERMVEAWQRARNDRTEGIRFHNAVQLRAEFPQQRRLGLDPIENQRLLQNVVSAQSLTASGGLCAPVNVRYELENSSTERRPVRDALARFGASRGGVRLITPPSLADAAPGVDIITEAEDAAGVTKPIVIASCGTEVEVVIHAVSRRIRFGNFTARTFPEQVQGWTSKAMAQHSREAEDELLSIISAGSTNVTTGQDLGTARDVLAALDQAATALRHRNRMDERAPLRAILPAWVLGFMRADLTRQMPGDSTLGVTDEQINSLFRVRNVNPTWHLDGTGFVAQADNAPLINWPDTITWFLFGEGHWLFLDGGVLDVGIVRDSSLNEANDFEIFAESFEAAAFIGDVQSFEITSTACATGEASALLDVGCAVGS